MERLIRIRPQELLLGAIFDDAPPPEELRAVHRQRMEQIFGAPPETPIREMVSTALSRLPDRERTVLRLRFGLEDGKPRTLKEVGDMIDRSPSTAR